MYRSIYTVKNHTVVFYDGSRIRQTESGKINKSARELCLVKAPKNTKTKEKVLVKTKAINLKKPEQSMNQQP